jgi:hypothetical protein
VTEVGALRDRGPQQVAGREVGQVQIGLQAIGLGALAGAGRTEEDQAGYRRNPS